MWKLDIPFLSEPCVGAVEEGCWEPRRPPRPSSSPYAADWWVLSVSSSPCSSSRSKDSTPRGEKLQKIQTSQSRAAPCRVAQGCALNVSLSVGISCSYNTDKRLQETKCHHTHGDFQAHWWKTDLSSCARARLLYPNTSPPPKKLISSKDPIATLSLTPKKKKSS